MRTALIIPVIAFAFLPVCAAFLFVRRSVLVKKLGKREIAYPHRMQFQFIGILLCTPVLIALNFWREFDPLSMGVISGTGVLGFYVALSDILLIRVGGLYEKGVVWNTAAILYSSIESFRRIDDSLSVEVTEFDHYPRRLSFDDPDMVRQFLSKLESTVSPLP